jgi:hypothetical protein
MYEKGSQIMNTYHRLWLMLLLGLLGCGVLASIYIHRFKDGGNLTPNKLSLFVLSCSVVIEMVRGYPSLLFANIFEILFMTAAGVYGGMIYRLQLTAIQHL